MLECKQLNKQDLSQAITKVLILTQYDAWIELDPDMTGGRAEGREKRAFDYYLGHNQQDPQKLYECDKFNHVIHLQTAVIMRQIERERANTPEQCQCPQCQVTCPNRRG